MKLAAPNLEVRRIETDADDEPVLPPEASARLGSSHLRHPDEPHEEVTLSGDRSLVLAWGPSRVLVYEAGRGRPVAMAKAGWDSATAIDGACWVGDGQQVAVVWSGAKGEGIVGLWSLRDDTVVVHAVREGLIRRIAASPGGRRLAFDAQTPGVEILDLVAGGPTRMLACQGEAGIWSEWGREGRMLALSFSPDGFQVAALWQAELVSGGTRPAGGRHVGVVWDLRTSREPSYLPLNDVPGRPGVEIEGLEPGWTREGRLLIRHQPEGAGPIVWDAFRGTVVDPAAFPHPGPRRLAELRGGAGGTPALPGRQALEALAVSPDRSRIATRERIWSWGQGKPLWLPRCGPVLALAFDPEGRGLVRVHAEGGEGWVVEELDAGSGETLSRREVEGRGYRLSFLSCDGRRALLVPAREPRPVRWVAMPAGELLYESKRLDSPGQGGIVCGPRGPILAGHGDRGILRIDPEKGTEAMLSWERPWNLWLAALDPEARRVALVGEGGPWRAQISVREVDSGATVAEVELPRGVEIPSRLVFAPCGRFLAAAADATIHVLDLRSLHLVASLEGHLGRVHRLEVSRDGSCLVSAGLEGTFVQWDLDRLKARRRQ